MKIAIPIFGSRVSPRFDCAEAFLLIAVESDMATTRTELASGGWAPHERINRLTELGVDTVLCGGIDCWSVASLRSVGVTVYASVAGEYEDALVLLLRGELDASTPGGGNRRRRCRRFLANDRATGKTPDQKPGQGRGCRQGQGRGRGQGRGQD